MAVWSERLRLLYCALIGHDAAVTSLYCAVSLSTLPQMLLRKEPQMILRYRVEIYLYTMSENFCHSEMNRISSLLGLLVNGIVTSDCKVT